MLGVIELYWNRAIRIWNKVDGNIDILVCESSRYGLMTVSNGHLRNFLWSSADADLSRDWMWPRTWYLRSFLPYMDSLCSSYAICPSMVPGSCLMIVMSMHWNSAKKAQPFHRPGMGKNQVFIRRIRCLTHYKYLVPVAGCVTVAALHTVFCTVVWNEVWGEHESQAFSHESSIRGLALVQNGPDACTR